MKYKQCLITPLDFPVFLFKNLCYFNMFGLLNEDCTINKNSLSYESKKYDLHKQISS